MMINKIKYLSSFLALILAAWAENAISAESAHDIGVERCKAEYNQRMTQIEQKAEADEKQFLDRNKKLKEDDPVSMDTATRTITKDSLDIQKKILYSQLQDCLQQLQ